MAEQLIDRSSFGKNGLGLLMSNTGAWEVENPTAQRATRRDQLHRYPRAAGIDEPWCQHSGWSRSFPDHLNPLQAWPFSENS
jgi:hypothetical protein